jgi:hypothetical protein
MRLVVKIVVPVVVLFAAMAAIAAADPVPPTTPFPDVPANATVCLDQKDNIERQQINYTYAKAAYDRANKGVNAGAAAQAQLRTAERALHLVEIALNQANYDEAACRNDLGNAANKVCIALALQYNRLVDEAPIRAALEALAKADYDAAVAAQAGGAGDQDTVDLTKRDWDLAKLDTRQNTRWTGEARTKITGNPACQGFGFQRPQPAPPPRPVPVSTTPPTDTVTTGPPTMTSPTDTGTTAPMTVTSPTDTATTAPPTTTLLPTS